MMGRDSKIEWTDHTFNPWIGCTKVSPGCKHCYAETRMDHRFGQVKWGPGQERKRTSAANWKRPVRWNKEAEGAAERPRVFCASLADVRLDSGHVVRTKLRAHINKVEARCTCFMEGFSSSYATGRVRTRGGWDREIKRTARAAAGSNDG